LRSSSFILMSTLNNELDEEDTLLCAKVDAPLWLAELATVVLYILGFTITICGVLFLTVHPPGEADLCNVNTLGLTNKTADEVSLALNGCHALYTTVFGICGVLAVVFIAIALLAISAACAVCSGACNPDAATTPGRFCRAAFIELIGVLFLWIPALFFPAMSGAVNVAMAPIHAYWITLTVANYGMQGINATSASKQVEDVTYVASTLYQGYCAAARFDLALTIGSICMILLWWTLVCDLIRNALNITCWKPQYDSLEEGSQCCHLRRAFGDKMRRDYPDPHEPFE